MADQTSGLEPNDTGGLGETGAVEPDPEATEHLEAPLGRRLLAEFVGTLTFVGVGTGAATALLIGPGRALGGISEVLGPDEGQQSVFGALLGNNLGDLLPVALAFAFALTFLVYAFGGISGAHFNPAVTFGLAVTGRFRWKDLPLYWVFQLLGGIAGALVVAAMYRGGEPSGADVLFGTTVIPDAVHPFSALLAEAFIAFVLVTAIMAVAVDPRAPKGWTGLVIGLALAAGIIVTAPVSGGSANFARTLGPMVAAALPFFDSPAIPWSDIWVYFFGPLIGAAAAALVYESTTGLEAIAPAPRPGAATPVTQETEAGDLDVTVVEQTEVHLHDDGKDEPPSV